MVKDRTAGVVLLERAGAFLEQEADDLRVASSACVDKWGAALRTRLVYISLATTDQGLDDFKVTFDCCTIEGGQATMIRCINFERLR